MSGILSISLSGLMSAHRALRTTSHNISNANTEGFSRQRTELASRSAELYGFGSLGTGVEVNSISRITDRFVDLRLQGALIENGRLGSMHDLSSQIDELMASDDGGLSPVLQSFFNSVQDVANNPSSAPARQVMLSEASSLADRFHYLDRRLDAIGADVNARIEGITQDMNQYAESIASLNRQIVAATGKTNGRPPNDLLDQRDTMIRDLSEKVAVKIIPQGDGALNVFIGNGQTLVVGGVAQQLVTLESQDDPTLLDVGYPQGSTVVRIGDKLRGGQIGGIYDFSREMLDTSRNELGRIATVIAETFNTQHAKGMDLNGDLGGRFFDNDTGSVVSFTANSGSAVIASSITDATQLTASDYSLRFDGANYTLERVSDGTSVSGAGPTLGMDGFSLSIGAGAVAGDSYLVRPTHDGARNFSVALKELDKIAVANPLRIEASINNLRDAPIGPITILDPANASLKDRIELRFRESPARFDVFDVGTATVLAAGVAYAPGDDYDLNGWRVRIDGTPAEGDVYTVEPSLAGVSDNRNALLLGALRDGTPVEGSSSYQQAYGSLVGRVGALTRQARFSADAQEKLTRDALDARDSVSGVSLDEEAINMTRYQRSYQAAAQAVNVANELFDSLLSAVRR